MTAGTATIHRDEWGVPHIRAECEEDGFFAIGYAQAQDHLDLLIRQYVVLRGELSRTVGAQPGALESDIQALRWRHLEESRAGFARLSPQLQLNASAFIEGVTAYLEAHPERCPDYVPPLEPALAVAVNRAAAFRYYISDAVKVCFNSDIEVPLEVTDKDLRR